MARALNDLAPHVGHAKGEKSSKGVSSPKFKSWALDASTMAIRNGGAQRNIYWCVLSKLRESSSRQFPTYGYEQERNRTCEWLLALGGALYSNPKHCSRSAVFTRLYSRSVQQYSTGITTIMLPARVSYSCLPFTYSSPDIVLAP